MEHNEPGEEAPREPDDDSFWNFDAPGNASSQNWWDHLSDHDPADEPLAATAPLPLPPDDRLWRHPSELANFASSDDEADRKHRRTILAASVLAGVAGAVVAGFAIWLIGPSREIVTERVIERQLVQPSAAFVSSSVGGVDVAAIADNVKPSIVRIEILNRLGTVVGSGSGVIFRDDGHVLTNSHVVADASGIEVITSDGHRYEALLVGADTLTDIAVVKVEAEDVLPVVLMGSTSTIRVGEPAIAVGSPLRLAGGPTVTVGVVSAIGRTLDLPDGRRLFDLVQTDAPISPGSSGGALVDGNGALIGVTTVIAVSEVGAEGLGFATPVEIAYNVAIDLVVNGTVRHGFLGVGGDDITGRRADDLGIAGGALVTQVGEATPAELAGLNVGDVIIAVDGDEVSSMSDLVVKIRRLDPGDTTRITLLRDSDQIVVVARIIERPN